MLLSTKVTGEDIKRRAEECRADCLKHCRPNVHISKDGITILGIIGKVGVTAKTTKQTGYVEQFTGHSQLDISNGPTLPSTRAEFVSEIDSHGAPEPGEVVEEKMRNVVFLARAFPKTAIL